MFDDYNTEQFQLTVSRLSLNELCSKKKKLDALINILTKAKERSMIQISFRIETPNIQERNIPRQNT